MEFSPNIFLRFFFFFCKAETFSSFVDHTRIRTFFLVLSISKLYLFTCFNFLVLSKQNSLPFSQFPRLLSSSPFQIVTFR